MFEIEDPKTGGTAVHVAIFNRQYDTLTRLVKELRAPLLLKGSIRKTPRELAVEMGCPFDIVDLLERNGRNRIFQISQIELGIKLIEAVLKGDIKEVQEICNGRTDPNYSLIQGYTALHLASIQHPEFISILLNAGADIHATDLEGDTPLHLAGGCQ